MKVKEVIEKINNGEYSSLWEVEEEVLSDYELVAIGLEVDKHRWFEVSTSVYKMEDGYVGVTGVTNVWGDMDCSDCNYPATASEYEEFTTISYRHKELYTMNKTRNIHTLTRLLYIENLMKGEK